MSQHSSDPRAVSCSGWIYERLLALYPSAHRHDYGPLMAQLFRDQCREAHARAGGWGLCKTWLSVLLDLGKSVCAEHWLTVKRKLDMPNKPSLTRGHRRLIAGVFLVILTAVVVVTFRLPRYFASIARIAVEKDGPQTPGGASSLANNVTVFDPYFIQTEFERLKSKELLYRVIDDLGLAKRWGQQYQVAGGLQPQEAYAILLRRVDVRAFRNTSLVEIRVLSEDRNEAAAIANRIVQVYQTMRLDQVRRASMEGLVSLRQELDQQESKVKEAQTKLEQLRADAPWSESYADGQSSQAAADLLPRLKNQVLDAEIAYQQMDSLCKRLKELSAGELRKTLPTAYPDTLLSELLSRYAQAEQEQLALRKENDKQVLAKINEQVEARIQGILGGLQFKAQTLEREMGLRQMALEKTLKEDAKNATQYAAYQLAKHDLEFQKQVRQSIMLKLQQEQLDAHMPRTPPITMVDPAEPGLKPVRPNYYANIAVGLVFALLASAALATIFFLKGSVTKAPPLSAA
jgi:uncharacterized protein involved in exopolysaccharide biosynthesis